MTNRSAIDVRQIVRSLQTDGVTLVENQLTDDQCQQALDGIEWGLQNKAGPQPLQRLLDDGHRAFFKTVDEQRRAFSSAFFCRGTVYNGPSRSGEA